MLNFTGTTARFDKTLAGYFIIPFPVSINPCKKSLAVTSTGSSFRDFTIVPTPKGKFSGFKRPVKVFLIIPNVESSLNNGFLICG